MTERFSYRGGKDERKQLHGSLEFGHDGSMMSGKWEHGRCEGYFNIENKGKASFILKMNILMTKWMER